MLITTHAHKAAEAKKALGNDPSKIAKLHSQIKATKKYFIFPVITQEHHAKTFLKTAFHDPQSKQILQAEFCIGKPRTENDFITRILNSIVI